MMFNSFGERIRSNGPGSKLHHFILSVLLLLSVAECQVIIRGTPPRFHSISGPILTQQRAAFNLECNASGTEPLLYRWQRDGRFITEASARHLFGVSSAGKTDGGVYRCLANNTIGAALSQPIRVDVAYFESFANDVPPPAREVRRGSPLVLRPPALNAAPLSDVIWTWYFYDSVVFPNLTHYISTTGELAVLNTQDSSAGPYKVEARHRRFPPNRVTQSLTYNVSITDSFGSSTAFLSDPVIVIPPKGGTFLPNEKTSLHQLQLDCAYSSSDLESVQVVWIHNNSEIVPDGFRYEIRDFKRRLVIKSPTAAESGVYACVASRGTLSRDRQEALVTVLETPKITSRFPAETLASVGRALQLSCHATGTPTPTVVWYKDGVRSTVGVVTPDGDLLIQSVTDRDAGVYQCEASNGAAFDIKTTWVRTQVSGPSFVVRPEDTSVSAGQPLRLLCRAAGAPPPSIQWRFNDTDVIPDGKNSRIESGGDLVIKQTVASDSGRYICLATNRQGTSDASAVVSVIGKTVITKGPSDQSVLIGSNVLFPCKTEQDPSSFSRVWYLNDQLLVPGSARNLEFRQDGSLYVTQVRPSLIGTYKCTVTSPAGTESGSGQLTIIEKPGMPLRVAAELLNDTLPAKISVSWTGGFDGNSPIIRYQIESRTLSSRKLWSNWEVSVENVDQAERSILIDNLKPSSTYEFRVIAINRYGPGMPSVPSNNVTLPQQPPAAAPQSPAVSARSSSAIMVQWQQPPAEQWNGDILGYVVRFRLANYPGIPWQSLNVSNVRARNVLLEDLITWREYEVQVAAYNQRGMGVFSKSMYSTTNEGAPTAAPSRLNVTVLDSTTVHVSFSAPSQQQIPGVNLGYKVEFWEDEIGVGGAVLMKRLVPESLSRIESKVDGLRKYGLYNVTVLCYTSAGDGPRSPPVQIRTKEDVPGPVESMHFDEVLFSSVKVMWEVPKDPNGEILGYTLNYWVTDRKSTIRSFDVSPDQTNYKVTGLNASTSYNFELFARTRVGKGPSEFSSMTSGVPPKRPGAPGALTISNVKSRTALLQFVPGYNGDTIINRWIIEGKVGDSSSWSLVYNVSDPKASSILIKRLRPFTKYRLRLIAENVVDRSPPSAEVDEFTTLQDFPEHSPKDLSAEPLSDNAIIVSWTPLQLFDWNGIPKGYVLYYKENVGTFSDTYSEKEIPDVSLGEYRLRDMKPFTTYDIRMLARNTLGKSNYSDTVRTTTYEGTPEISPGNVRAVATSSKVVRVSWEAVPPTKTNGRILGYKLRIRPENERFSYEARELDISNPIQKSFSVEALRPFSSYIVHVCAFTVVGCGPPNEPAVTIRTLGDIPGKPSGVFFEVVSTDRVHLSWREPYEKNGIVTTYSVTHWKNGTEQRKAARAEVPQLLYLYPIINLDSEALYNVGVSAKTDAGWGAPAILQVYATSSKLVSPVPDAPIQALEKDQSAHHIWIKWTINGLENIDIAKNKAPVRLIDVEYQHTNENHWTPFRQRVPGTTSLAKIDGLRANTKYRFRVKSRNDFGRSSFSGMSAWIPTLAAPPSSPPLDISAVPYDSNSIKVYWRPPDVTTWNSDFVGYRILYKVYDIAVKNSSFAATVTSSSLTRHQRQNGFKTKEVKMTSNKDQMELLVEELPRLKHYLVQLQTFNERGSSPASLPPVFLYVGYSIPKVAVKGLRAEPLESTQIRLAWDPWPDDSEPIAGYRIRYQPIDASSTADWMEEVVRADTNRVTLTNLRKFTDYRLRLLAFNKAGEGPPTTVDVRTGEDKPGPVTNLRFDNILLDSVDVRWEAPLEKNGRITGYKVHYKTFSSNDESRSERQERTDGGFFHATSLEENSTYTFEVRAETIKGYGSPVIANVNITSPPGAPKPPSKPRIYTSGKSLTLEWRNNGEGRGPIIGFVIQGKRIRKAMSVSKLPLKSADSPGRQRVKRAAPEDWHVITTVASSQPVYELSYEELERASVYQFRVYAKNTIGISFPSQPSDEIEIPEKIEEPFYQQWTFLVMLALASLVVIVVIIAVLCITGRNNKYMYEKRGSVDSLQLADGGIVSYELRASQRARNNLQRHNRHRPQRSDPTNIFYGTAGSDDPATVEIGSSQDPPPYPGARPTNGKAPSFYGSLATDTLPPDAANTNTIPRMYSGGSRTHLITESSVDPHRAYMERSGGGDTSTTAEESGDEAADGASIVQHYEASGDYAIETWRRARQNAAASSNANGVGVRPPSANNSYGRGDAGSATYVDRSYVTTTPGTTSHYSNQPGSRAPIPGFSSFV